VSSSISLTNAVTAGDESAVSALLASGADVNETTNGGQTALILAVISGRTNLVRTLLRAGADPQLRDNLGLNAIEWAQRRGLTEAQAILTNSPEPATRPSRIHIPPEERELVFEPPPPPRVNETKNVDEDEKSRRWIAGVKQRLDEQAMRRLNRNQPPLEPRLNPATTSPEPPVAAHKEVSLIQTSKTEEPRITGAPRILTPPTVDQPKSGKRKRCPKCNAIYNGDLISYCAHHVVALVDADEPIVTETPKSNTTLFWVLLIITLTAAVVAGSLITTYIYKSNQVATPIATEPQRIVQRGTPAVGEELAGKVVSLPEAECPIKGPEPASGTVTVSILVDKNGHVNRARGAGGDWLMRGCATEAAMKSTFAQNKLRGREVESTITYTFKP